MKIRLVIILLILTVSGVLFSNTVRQKKVAIIIPGRGEHYDNEAYIDIKHSFELKNYTTYILNIDWDVVTLDNLVSIGEQAITPIINRHRESDITLLGFSFGAVIALKNSHQNNINNIILVSLSSLFKEDLPHHLSLLRFFATTMTDYNSNELFYPKETDNNLVFFYGSRDSFLINKKIINQRTLRFPNSELIIVKGAKHDISGKNYQEAIKTYITTLE